MLIIKALIERLHVVFLIIVFVLILCLFIIKTFTFPVHESIHFIAATDSFKSSISTFWHTPAYFLLLFSFRQLFSDPFLAAQMLGLLSVYISSLVIFSIIKKLEIKFNLKPEIKYIASLINIIYVPIYNSIFLFDIDNTILVPFLLFLIDYFISNINKEKKWQLSLLLVLLFWIKEVVFPPILLFFLIVYFLEFGFQPGFKKFFPLLIISTILSFISYGIFSHVIFGNWGAITFNGGKLLSMGKNNQYNMSSLIMKIGSVLLWGGPYIFVLILCNIRQIIKDNNLKYFFLFICFYTFIFVIPWPAEAGGWPKYAIPSFSFLIVVSALLFKEIDHKKLIVFIIPLSLLYLFLGDYIYKAYYTLQFNEVDISYITIRLFLYVIFPIIFIVTIKRFLKLSRSFLILIIFISQNIGLLTNQIAADYSTNYHYGVHGTEQVIRYIKDNKIESITDFDIYNKLFKQDKNKKKIYIIKRDLFFATNRFEKSSNNEDYLKLINDYNKVKQIGSYQIWKKIEHIPVGKVE